IKEFSNEQRSRKYSWWNFPCIVLYQQFRQFLNLFYLILALSQLWPPIAVGPAYTYILPLAFTLSITLLKEFLDDWKRRAKDWEINTAGYQCTTFGNYFEDILIIINLPGIDPDTGALRDVPARDIRAGDFILLKSNQRVPADCLFIHTTSKSAQTYVRTDQLDGETDWKLRKPVALVQRINAQEMYRRLTNLRAMCRVESPHKDIYNFQGRFSIQPQQNNYASISSEGLTLEHTLWRDTVVTEGDVVGFVIFTGCETR
ncbi:unnamed protein product, partial [Amoebophrya sp. A25]